jgi:hypothetical protein
MENLKELEALQKEYSVKNKRMIRKFQFSSIKEQTELDSFLLDLFLNSGISEKKIERIGKTISKNHIDFEEVYWCDGIAQDDVVKTDLMKSVLNGKRYVSIYVRITHDAKVSLISQLRRITE